MKLSKNQNVKYGMDLINATLTVYVYANVSGAATKEAADATNHPIATTLIEK
jgi:hypothetical protein